MNGGTQPSYYLDESLSPYIVEGLSGLNFNIDSFPKGTLDSRIIGCIGKRHGRFGVWISSDRRAKRIHREDILNAGISVAWIRENHAHVDKQCFLVCSFMYCYRDVIAASDEPLYFYVRERVNDGIRTLSVESVAL